MVNLIASMLLIAAQSPQIVTRAEWGAKPIGPNAIEHTIERITIHHGGVMSNPKRTLEAKLVGLQTFSQRVDKLASGKEKPAWPDIPYHYYISIDGRIGEGRETKYMGDTNTEYNPKGHLLIMVEGDFGKEKPTEAELTSLRSLTLWCAQQWRIPAERIASHRDYSQQTDCPGAALTREMPVLRSFVRRNLRD